MVASTHSARLHAWVLIPGATRLVTWSSQSSATLAAWSTCADWAGEMLWSPAAETALRAVSVASATLNGSSPVEANIACTWAVTIWSMAGSILSMPMPSSIRAISGSMPWPPVRPDSIAWISGGS